MSPAIEPFLEWLGVFAGGELQLPWLRDPAAGLRGAFNDRLDQLVRAMEALLGARDADGLGVPPIAGETWHPLVPLGAGQVAIYLVLSATSDTTRVSLALRSAQDANPLTFALTARIPLFAISKTMPSVTWLLGEPGGSLDVAIEVDKLAIGVGAGAARVALDGARLGISVAFDSATPVHASLDLLDASIGGAPPATISVADLAGAELELLRDVVRAVVSSNPKSELLATVIGLTDGVATSLPWSSLAGSTPQALLAWLGRIAADDAARAAWGAALTNLIGAGAAIDLGLTADGFAPRVSVTTSVEKSGVRVSLIGAVAPFALSFHGAAARCPGDVSLAMVLEGVNGPLVRVAEPPPTASIDSARVGLQLSPTSTPWVVPSVILANVSIAGQTWPSVTLAQLETPIALAGAAASSVLQRELGDAAALIALFGLDSEPAIDLAMFASDPLRALDCFWRAQQIPGPLLERVADLLRLAKVTPAPDVAWAVELLDDGPLHVALDLGFVPALLPADPRTVFASLDAWTSVSDKGIAANVRIVPRLVEMANGALCKGSAPPPPAWLPQNDFWLTIASAVDGDKIVLDGGSIVVTFTKLVVHVIWRVGLPPLPLIGVEGLTVALNGSAATALPAFKWSAAGWSPAIDLKDPSFGLGNVDAMTWLLGFALHRAGSLPLGLSLVLGWQPALPALKGAGWDWPTLTAPTFPEVDWGKWPTFSPAAWGSTWPKLALDPLGGLRGWWTKLFADPSRVRASLALLSLGWSGKLPDIRLAGDGVGSALPAVELAGSGTYTDPWALTILAPGLRRIELIAWVEMLGPLAVPRVSGVGWGFRLKPLIAPADKLAVETNLRLDVGYVAVESSVAAEPIPAFHVASTVRNATPDAPIAQMGASKLTRFTVGACFSGDLDVTPEIRLEGDVQLAVSGGQRLPAGMRDALASVFSAYGTQGGSAAFRTVCAWLVEVGVAVETGGAFGPHPNGLDALAADPTHFVLAMANAAWADPSRRGTLSAAASDLFGKDLVAAFAGPVPGSAAALLRDVCTALGWAAGADAWFPNASAILALLRAPGPTLASATASLTHDAEARAKLRAAIAAYLASASPNGPLTVALSSTNIATLAVALTPTPAAAAALVPLQLQVGLTLDLAKGAVALDVGAQGRDLGIAIPIGRPVPASVQIGGTSYTLDAPGFAGLVEGVCRLVIAGLGGAATASAAQANPALAQLLSAIGWTAQAGDGNPIYADDLVDLLRTTADVSAWTRRLGPAQPAGIAGAVARVGRALTALAPSLFHVAADGTVSAGATAEGGVSAAVSLSPLLVPSVSLSFTQPLAAAALARRPALAAADVATLTVTRTAGTTAVSLAVGSNPAIQLFPLGGATALLGAAGAATALLPYAMQLLANNVPVDAVDLGALAIALDLDATTAKDWVTDPIAALAKQLASAPALYDALATIPGIAKRAGGGVQVAIAGLTANVAPSSFDPATPSLSVQATVGAVTAVAEVAMTAPAAAPAKPLFSLRASLAPAIPIGFGVAPNASVSISTATPLAVSFQPAGPPTAGAPALQIQAVPAFAVTGARSDGTTAPVQDALQQLGRAVLLPAVGNWVMSSPTVAGFLDGPGPGAALASALVAAELAKKVPPWTVTSSATPALDRLLNGLASLLGAAGVAWWPAPAAGLSVSPYVSGGDLGLRLQLPDLKLPTVPAAVAITTTVPTPWPGTGSPDYGGIVVVLLNGSRFAPRIVATLGVAADGSDAQPLVGPLGGASLKSIKAWVRATLPLAGKPTFAYRIEVDGLSLPLGAIGDASPVLDALLGSTSDNTPSSPTRAPTLAAALTIDETGSARFDLPSPVVVPIQAGFGPIQISELLLEAAANGQGLSIGLDASAMIGQLAVELDDLAVTVPAATPFDVGKWGFSLTGLGIAYTGNDVAISGKLLRSGTDYEGLCSLQFGGYGLGAVGGFSSNPTSFYIFAALDAPIGGPPCFFVTGVAAGFGYNRTIRAPTIDEVPKFPLVQVFGSLPPLPSSAAAPQASAATGAAATSSPTWFPVKRGAGWFALGLKFTTFVVIHGRAVAYVELGDGVEIGLVGDASLMLPTDDHAIVSIELLLLARLSTREGLFSIQAQLSTNSWLFTQDCHLTGGFAFYVWFGGEHRGDFVITLGGYHPRYQPPSSQPPAWYPAVPRLGFAWVPTKSVVISGQAYFALTPSCVMAGGRLDARYNAGGIQAWFTAYADILVEWKPFHYDFDIGISIGVKCWVANVELSASVHLWGPKLSAEVHVKIFVVSFTVSFGSGDSKAPAAPIGLDEFKAELPSADASGTGGPPTLLCGNVGSGLLPRRNPQDAATVVGPTFSLQVESAFPLYKITVQGQDVLPGAGVQIDFAPMDLVGENPTLTVTVVDASTKKPTKAPAQCAVTSGAAPVALWKAPSPIDDTSLPRRQDDAYKNVARGVTISFPATPVGSFGSFKPAGRQFALLEGWNPLLADAPAPADMAPDAHREETTKKGAHRAAVGPADMRRPRALALAGELVMAPGAPPSTRRWLERAAEAKTKPHEMAWHPLVPGCHSRVELESEARVVQLDDHGRVVGDAVTDRVDIVPEAALCLVGAPLPHATRGRGAIVGWTLSSLLTAASPRHLVGPACVVRTDRRLTWRAPRQLGGDPERVWWHGNSLRCVATATRFGGVELGCVAVLLDLDGVGDADLDRALRVVDYGTKRPLEPKHVIAHGSQVTVLYEHAAAGIEVADHGRLRGVVGFAEDLRHVARATSRLTRHPELIEHRPRRHPLTYRFTEK